MQVSYPKNKHDHEVTKIMQEKKSQLHFQQKGFLFRCPKKWNADINMHT